MKKWTYLVATLLMAGTTPMLTGCIDNDEPEGINILRQAKAELIKAKAAVEAARVAQMEAENALKLAQAKTEEARAKQEEAKAKQEEAKALKLQYEAEAAQAATEAEKAEAQARIAQAELAVAAAEAEAKRVAAQLEVDLLNIQTNLTKAQALYEEALKDLLIAQNTLTENQKAYLAPYVAEVEAAKAQSERANRLFEQASKRYIEVIANLDYEQAKESHNRELKRDVAEKEAAYAAAQEATIIAKEYAEAEIETATKWEEKQKELEDKLNALEKTLADLTVERTELEMATAGQYEAIKEMADDFTKWTGRVWVAEEEVFGAEPTQDSEEKFALPELKVVIPSGIGLPAYAEGIRTIEEAEYMYSDYLKAIAAGDDFETSHETILNEWLKEVESWRRSDNDNAWTAARLVIAKANLAEVKKEVDAAAERWSEVANIYNENAATNSIYIDATKLEGYAELKTLIDDYNEKLDILAEKEALVDEAEAAVGLIGDEYDELLVQIKQKRDDAFAAAVAERDKTIEEAEAKSNELGQKWETAYNELREAEAKLAVARLQNNTQEIARLEGLIEDTVNATTGAVTVKGLRTVTSEAWQAYWDYRYSTAATSYDAIVQNARELYSARISEATATYYKERYECNLQKPEFDAAEAAAQEKLETALDDAAKAGKDVDEAWIAANNALQELRHYEGVAEISIPVREAADIDELTAIKKEEIAYAVIERSKILYGEEFDDPKNFYGDWNAEYSRLLEQDIEKAALDYYKKVNPKDEFVKTNGYMDILKTHYGLAGQYLAQVENIALGEAYLNNTESIEQVRADILAKLVAVAELRLEHTNIINEKETALMAAIAELGEVFAEVDAAIEKATAEKLATKPVLDAVNNAISTYLRQESLPEGSNAEFSTIDQLREALKSIYEEAVVSEQAAYDALVDAKELLADAIKGDEEAYAIAQKALYKAQEKAEAASQRLTEATDALAAAMARIEAGYDPTLEIGE